jgi:hypothetical protein
MCLTVLTSLSRDNFYQVPEHADSRFKKQSHELKHKEHFYEMQNTYLIQYNACLPGTKCQPTQAINQKDNTAYHVKQWKIC